MRKGFEVEKETKNIIDWIKNYSIKNNMKKAIIGISGGKDSTIVAKLLCLALGSENVYGVLMPNGIQKDISDSYRVVEQLGIDYCIVNISNMYDDLLNKIQLTPRRSKINSVTVNNIPPRLRMTTLYAIASTFEGGRVVCTGNMCEEFVGYSTKWGDGAGDFAPIINYSVDEVMTIGRYINLPEVLITKPPADGLTGKTDEDQLGFTYKQVELVATYGSCGDANIDEKIMDKFRANKHKTESFNPPSPNPIFLEMKQKM